MADNYRPVTRNGYACVSCRRQRQRRSRVPSSPLTFASAHGFSSARAEAERLINARLFSRLPARARSQSRHLINNEPRPRCERHLSTRSLRRELYHRQLSCPRYRSILFCFISLRSIALIKPNKNFVTQSSSNLESGYERSDAERVV